MKPLRVYADTSVIGGCLDEEFAVHSRRLIDQVRSGRVVLLISEVVARELSGAPWAVQRVLAELPGECVEPVSVDQAVLTLRDAYIRAGVVSPKWIDDATHVAAATLARADAIVSWNFRHIVRLDKIKAYNDVNRAHGYGPLTILSPIEVDHGDED